jgi:hypothetical protein
MSDVMRIRWCLMSLAFWLALIPFYSFSQQINISPIPSWLSPAEPDVTAQPIDGNAGGYYYLLIEQQEHVSKQESFIHNAYRFLTAEGIQAMADININFDPTYQKLIFHKLVIRRDGQIVDQLKKENIRTIQREQSMDRYIYDGSLTAIVNLKDIRVNDVVEYAYTIKGYNPIYEGHIAHRLYLNYSLPFEKSVKKIIVPSARKLYFKFNNDAAQPIEQDERDNTKSYTWISENVSALLEDNNTPSWYDSYQNVQVTDFENWSDVASWSWKHFSLKESEKASLKSKVANLWKVDGDKEKLIHSIIRFVQDEVRYLGFESGLNSHKPHGPVKVFDQRFGDCKDKSLLLSTILQLYGVEAYPMLVNTNVQKHITSYLPTINAFNHCVVQINHQGKDIYVDPTISSQGGLLYNIYFPNYGSGLVIKEGETSLTKLPEVATGETKENDTFEINFLEGEATLSIRTTYNGSDADNQRSYFASSSLETIQKSYVTFYGNLYPDIKEAKLIKTKDNRDENIFIVEESYKVPSFWKPNAEKESQMYGEFYSLSLENLVNVSKSSTRTAPYRLSYPTSFQHTIQIKVENWNIESEETTIQGDAYKYRYEVSYVDNLLSIYHHYRTLRDHVEQKDLAKFVKDHQAIMKNLSYMIYIDNGSDAQTGVSWPAIIGGFICLALAGVLFRFLYFNYDPSPVSSSQGQPIGGWLVLVAIGLSLTPLRFVYDMVKTPEFFDHATWSSLWGQWGLFTIFFLEYIYNIFYLLFSILLIVLFFNRRSSLPLLISIFYGVTFVATLLDTLVAMNLDQGYTSQEQNEYYTELFKRFIVAAIWIPYFQVSERVKETFVERLEPKQGEDNTVTYTFRN